MSAPETVVEDARRQRIRGMAGIVAEDVGVSVEELIHEYERGGPTGIEESLWRGGIELTLIDQMAQAHSLYLFWIERAHVQASLDGTKQQRELSRTGRWIPRTLGVAEALDQSAQMAERWQKLFVRALRALRDLRRHAPPVVVAAPGSQVNVGTVQSNSTGTRADD